MSHLKCWEFLPFLNLCFIAVVHVILDCKLWYSSHVLWGAESAQPSEKESNLKYWRKAFAKKKNLGTKGTISSNSQYPFTQQKKRAHNKILLLYKLFLLGNLTCVYNLYLLHMLGSDNINSLNFFKFYWIRRLDG